ncbi:hypothetical protein C2L64_45950 [Paraburkholderia hospita]|uniref:Uncharacterized protein n=1 Tax=Paraburkholderia hospita TaxID=169430 RepID=A0AAN1JKI8_9BURK|nr:hypothetical protein [Paraburkholderia hospita]AUT75687.1 hypothetical protein C2L64_45950 [Paraburkholderia hospita]
MAIYVGVLRDTVNVYDDKAVGDAVPVRSIHGPSTGFDGVVDVVLDSLGNLYVGNAAPSTITVYTSTADGDAAPIRIIRGGNTGLAIPGSLAIDSADNLYVLNTGGVPSHRKITVYGPGASGDVAPIRTLTGIQVGDIGNLNGIAIDNFDNLYLSQDDMPRIISVYPPGANGSVAPIRTISGGSTGLAIPSQMAFDSFNNLYVSDGIDILVFDPGASGDAAPIRKISGPSTGIVDDFDLAVDAAGLVYVGNFPTDLSAGSVTVYSAGASGDAAPIRTISGIDTGIGVPSGGIAISKEPAVTTQDNWRWCNKCEGLFFAADTTSGACAAGGGHNYAESGNYVLAIAPAAGQDNWRWCHKCEGLFFAGDTTTGACTAGGGHDYRGSGDYVLRAAPETGQDNWRWCHKCEGLFFAGDTTTGACPAGGGHDYKGSGNYVLASH